MLPKSQIRVAMIVRPAEGGIRKHVSLLTAGLAARGYEVAVFAPPGFNLEPNTSSAPLVPIDIQPRTRVIRDLASARMLASKLKGRYNVVHAHGLRAAAIGVIAARLAKLPVTFTGHNLLTGPISAPDYRLIPVSPIQGCLLRRIGARTGIIAAVSAAVKLSFESVGIPGEKIRVIPNGIPVEEFCNQEPADIPELWNAGEKSGIILAYVGRLSPEKGVEVLVEAVKICIRSLPELRLIIAGSGPEDPKLRALASRDGLSAHVVFLGTRSDIPSVLAAADIVVVSSYLEGQGIAAIEAMAAGKPVIASNVGGLAETVIDGETGILSAAGNQEAFADAILRLARDPAARARMGAAGKLRARAEYSIETMLGRVEQVYSDLLAAVR